MGILIAYYNTKTGLVGKVMGVSTNEVPLEFSPWQSISLSFFFFFFFFFKFHQPTPSLMVTKSQSVMKMAQAQRIPGR